MNTFPIIDFFGPNGVPNEWTISHPDRLSVGIGSDASTVVRSSSQQSSYLIHLAELKHFQQLPHGRGIPVQPGSSFSISIDIEASESAHAKVHVLEYDESGARRGESQIAPSASVHYVPRPMVRTIVFTIRAVGMGDVLVRDFTVRTLQEAANAGPGVHPLSHTGELTELRRDIVALEDVGRRIGRQLNSMLSVLESGVSSHDVAGGANAVTASTHAFLRDLLVDMAQSLPTSNGSHHFSRRFRQRVAIVTDVYMYNFYKDSFRELVYVHPEHVDKVIDDGFDLLLYVTCWKGVRDEEWRGIKFRETPATALSKLISHSRTHNIPTIFQSIEDPSNFEYFLPIAEQFDYVFTSDSDCIERYRATLGHDRVFYGEYGANPLLNNPIGSHRFNIDRAFFAGSYPKRYRERIEDMEVVFDSILRAGPYLQIADRNAGADGLEFPTRFEPFCLPPIPHEVLQRVHKLFRYSLNFNSIKASPTMCAMRVYELQAHGRGIISNYARSVLNKFPEIRILAHPEHLDSYFTAPRTHEEHQLNEQLIRNVMTSATSFDIVGRMLEAIGIDTEGVTEAATVAVFGDLSDPGVKRAIDCQTYPKLIAVDLLDSANAISAVPPEARYFCIMDSSVEYGPHYITDRVNAFKYVDVDFVTQIAVPRNEGDLDGPVHEFTSTAPRPEHTLYAADRVQPTTALHSEALLAELRGYAIAPYEATSLSAATSGQDFGSAAPPVLSIIVPVFGNGRFLMTKCMPSIMRNPRWRMYEVLLVDDGSQDEETKRVCEHFVQRYPNVRLYSFEDAGSGSASRPRNKGVELARAPLVTFLDPDNEISDGGYDTLMDLYAEGVRDHPGLGFVSGYQVKVAEGATTTGRLTNERLTIVDDAKDRFFEAGKFPVVSTQAAVISKEVLKQSGVSFVEGAAGQDTLFGWELLLRVDVAAFTTAAHLIYYAERSDSITNAVTPNYFEKALVMEQAQVSALREHGIYQAYVDHHLVSFVRGWYMKKLDQVSSQDLDASSSLVRQIVALYGADLDEIAQSDVNTQERDAS